MEHKFSYWTRAEVEYAVKLKEKGLTYANIIDLLYQKFGMRRNIKVAQKNVAKYGYEPTKRIKKKKTPRKHFKYWSDAEKETAKDYALQGYPYKAIAEIISRDFGTNRTLSSIYNMLGKIVRRTYYVSRKNGIHKEESSE